MTFCSVFSPVTSENPATVMPAISSLKLKDANGSACLLGITVLLVDGRANQNLLTGPAPAAGAHSRRRFLDYSSTSPPKRVCLILKMTNSAGFEGQIPIKVITCPRSIVSAVFVSSLHLTKKAFSSLSPTIFPSDHCTRRKALTSRVMRFQRLGSLGSKTRPWVPFRIDC